MVLPWCWGVYIVDTLNILMQKCSKRCSLTAWNAVIFAWSVDRRISVKGHARHRSQCKRPMFIASNSFSNPSPNPLYNHLTLPKSLIWLPNIFLFHTKARQQVSHQALLLKGWLRFLGEESVLPLRWPGRQNWNRSRWWRGTHSALYCGQFFHHPLPPRAVEESEVE